MKAVITKTKRVMLNALKWTSKYLAMTPNMILKTATYNSSPKLLRKALTTWSLKELFSGRALVS
jgi:hypothetical protein